MGLQLDELNGANLPHQLWTFVDKVLWYIESMDPDESKKNTKVTKEPNSKENHLKIEWSLFWEGLLGDAESREGDGQDEETQEPVRILSREKIQTIIKELSAQRKQLHKQIEKINKELELNSTKLESLKLVGSEPEDTIARINELTDKGHELSLQLEKLDEKLKWARNHEKEATSSKDFA